jgi:hypothetical protein
VIVNPRKSRHTPATSCAPQNQRLDRDGDRVAGIIDEANTSGEPP